MYGENATDVEQCEESKSMPESCRVYEKSNLKQFLNSPERTQWPWINGFKRG
jgi:hypothetical protein